MNVSEGARKALGGWRGGGREMKSARGISIVARKRRWTEHYLKLFILPATTVRWQEANVGPSHLEPGP